MVQQLLYLPNARNSTSSGAGYSYERFDHPGGRERGTPKFISMTDIWATRPGLPRGRKLVSTVILQLAVRTGFLLAEADKQKISHTPGETDLPVSRCPASGKDQTDAAET